MIQTHNRGQGPAISETVWSHQNVVEFIGAVMMPGPPILPQVVVMEYCQYSLADPKFKNDVMYNTEYYLDQQARVYIRISYGMSQRGWSTYTQKVVHNDIKPANILVNMEGKTPTCKLADFGLACLIDKHSQTAEVYTTVSSPSSNRSSGNTGTISTGIGTHIYGPGVVRARVVKGTQQTIKLRLRSICTRLACPFRRCGIRCAKMRSSG